MQGWVDASQLTDIGNPVMMDPRLLTHSTQLDGQSGGGLAYRGLALKTYWTELLSFLYPLSM